MKSPLSQASPSWKQVQLPSHPFDVRPTIYVTVFSVASCLVLDFEYHQAAAFTIVVSFLLYLRHCLYSSTNSVDNTGGHSGVVLAIVASLIPIVFHCHDSLRSETGSPRLMEKPMLFILALVFIETVQNGTPLQKEQVASYLRWSKTSGITGTLTAEIVETMTWVVLEFESRYGQLRSDSKDIIVAQCACIGLRVGVPSSALALDYKTFVANFEKRMAFVDQQIIVGMPNDFQPPDSTISGLITRVAFLLGFDLLPPQLQRRYAKYRYSFAAESIIYSGLQCVLWLLYPILQSVPLRVVVGIATMIHTGSRDAVKDALDELASMDIIHDQHKSKDIDHSPVPSHVRWLSDEVSTHSNLLQKAVEECLLTQHKSSSLSFFNPHRARLIALSVFRILLIISIAPVKAIVNEWQLFRISLVEKIYFMGKKIQSPQHVGIVMDGNRRWAKELGKPTMYGHDRGAFKAAELRAWWMRFAAHSDTNGPKAMTVWAFSNDNHKRSTTEVSGLFAILIAEFKDMAFSPLIHLFQIRVRIIGSRDRLPAGLLAAIDLLEAATQHHSRFFYQIAVGYGGKLEVVEAIDAIQAKGLPVTDKTIDQHTLCARTGLPPVDYIVRTSERRTSGFFLWDTHGAELHFLEKLWPDLTEKDWCDALVEFSRRQRRGGV